MLILTRRIGEKLKIGENVTLDVLEVKGNQVRLGINAPRHITVHREEIYDKIQSKSDADAQRTEPTEEVETSEQEA